MIPQRIQLSRKKGWRMPPGAVKVDRTTAFGNPWTVKEAMESGLFEPSKVAEVCVNCFRAWLGPHGLKIDEFPIYRVLKDKRKAILARLPELRGKDLACWCKPGAPCHADVLIELANV